MGSGGGKEALPFRVRGNETESRGGLSSNWCQGQKKEDWLGVGDKEFCLPYMGFLHRHLRY